MVVPPFEQGQSQQLQRRNDQSRWLPGTPGANSAGGSPELENAVLDPSRAQSVAPLPWTGAKPGECYRNVNRFVVGRGGSFATGWAWADDGPLLKSGHPSKPLYRRWIHHLVWEDWDHRLWEVTPYYNVSDHTEIAWLPTSFIVDGQSIPQIKPDGSCWMLPARFVPTCGEGRDVVKCLNGLQRDGLRYETYWLQQAMQAVKKAGFEPDRWHIERIDGRINNVWLFAQP